MMELFLGTRRIVFCRSIDLSIGQDLPSQVTRVVLEFYVFQYLNIINTRKVVDKDHSN